jgi:hypothetical protein
VPTTAQLISGLGNTQASALMQGIELVRIFPRKQNSFGKTAMCGGPGVRLRI